MKVHLLALACSAVALIAASDGGSNPGPDRGTLAVRGEHALVLWDATDDAKARSGDGVSSADVMAWLERRSVEVAALNAGLVPNARTLTVRIVIRETQAAGAYGAQAYESSVPLAAVTLGLPGLRAHRAAWLPPHELATLPSEARLVVLGTLPNP